MLYIPFNIDKTQYDRSSEGFEGSANLSRIDNINITIVLDNAHTKICIYGLRSNMLRQINGASRLAFHYELSEHNIIVYDDDRIISNTIISSTSINRNTQNSTQNIIYKPITNNEKLKCCITHEGLAIDKRYMSCTQCCNNYDADAINEWFRQRVNNKTCPMCRISWIDFNIYINGEELDVNSNSNS